MMAAGQSEGVCEEQRAKQSIGLHALQAAFACERVNRYDRKKCVYVVDFLRGICYNEGTIKYHLLPTWSVRQGWCRVTSMMPLRR